MIGAAAAQEMAGDASEEARGQLASVVCAESFLAAPDAAVQLAALQEIDSSYQQRRFVQDGGWATMPGHDSPDRRGADLCVKVLADRAIGRTATVEPGTVQ